jgi:hypothetical protein
MNKKELRKLFSITNSGPWNTAGNDTQYKVAVECKRIILAFAPSSSKQDWIDNFAFPVRPYRDMPYGWLAHGGFVRAWKAARDAIVADVMSILGDNQLVITGYSHGGALATLAHENFVFHGLIPMTVIFGSPRVLWMPPKALRHRFRDVTVIRNRGDIVTHLPPWLFGYQHVGEIVKIGKPRMIGVRPHYPVEYERSMGHA